MKQHPEFRPDANSAWTYFQHHPNYQPTPLDEIELPAGLRVLVKDETSRLGLSSFKALGAPYAIARMLAFEWQAMGHDGSRHLWANDPAFTAFASSKVFVAASAGNHGMALTAGAKALGAQARIFLSTQVPAEFEAALHQMGAQTVRAGATYEESMAAALLDAEQTGALLVSDSSWPGYTHPPSLVMEGYTVIAEELRLQFENTGAWPSHVFLQCGVGGLAAAMAHMIRHNWHDQPNIIIVEPEQAACMQASHVAGGATEVFGPVSAMGRLDCKVPSILAWRTLERCNAEYITISDREGEDAAAVLSDLGKATTSSGAAGLAGSMKLHRDKSSGQMMRPLVIVTEAMGANNVFK